MNSIHQKRYEMNQLKKKRIEKLFQDCQDTIIAQTLSVSRQRWRQCHNIT